MSDRSSRSAAPLPGQGPKKDRSWRFYVAIAVAIVALVVIFQNSQDVRVDFLFASASMPLFFVLIIAFALGALVGWLWPHVHRDRKRQSGHD
jgi:uncharacterized integral membrane protein